MSGSDWRQKSGKRLPLFYKKSYRNQCITCFLSEQMHCLEKMSTDRHCTEFLRLCEYFGIVFSSPVLLIFLFLKYKICDHFLPCSQYWAPINVAFFLLWVCGISGSNEYHFEKWIIILWLKVQVWKCHSPIPNYLSNIRHMAWSSKFLL